MWKHKRFKSNYKDSDVAIIGMACRFAESQTPDGFWQNLTNNKDLICEIPPDRWDYRSWFDPTPQTANKTYSKWGSFIKDIDQFDPSFFNISPHEAELMDPQLRLLLIVLYETVEDAGYAQNIWGSKTGMFVGAWVHEYRDEIIKSTKGNNLYKELGNHASMLSNRPSYFFDLRGPSLSVDTACSSSLVALHLACKSLHHGECDMAFVGSANLLLSPLHYLWLCELGVLSPTGRCNTLDEGADGYVPGEGVVSLLLKPLKKAIQDNDNIHAIIKGSSVNHGGRAGSPTAPRTKQQTEVFVNAWKDAKINPENITYLEAHGTGTEVGDQVEVKALRNAFKQFTDKKGFCCIGSAKAHIGHTEGAAGITGVMKAALSMKNKTIPSMPDFKKLNPSIKLEDSPFFINKRPQKWEIEEGYPLQAGISSFGMGGAYAHVVLEEFNREETEISFNKRDSDKAEIVLLSAKTEEQLKDSVKRFKDYLDETDSSNLRDIAYTLQVGREFFEERLAVISKTKDELIQKIGDYLDNKDDVVGVLRGSSKKNRDLKPHLSEKQERSVIKSIQAGQLNEAALFWVEGSRINWEEAYKNDGSQRISLPTYPFAKERCWISASENTSEISVSGGVAKLHPLIDINVSTLEEERFKKTFHGNEFYLRDHIVMNQRVLPGTVYLEMVRAAGRIATGSQIKSIRNIVWASPISVGGKGEDVYISLFPNKDSVGYEVSTRGGAKKVIHSQGGVIYKTEEEKQTKFQNGQSEFDIDEIKGRCLDIKKKEEIYALFKSEGITYGPSFQCIQEIHTNGREALSRIRLPDEVREGLQDYLLHPSVLDGAFQTVISIADQTFQKGFYLPFALGALDIIRPLTENCYAYVTAGKGDSNGSTRIKKFDICIIDEEGNALVHLKDFSVRALRGLDRDVSSNGSMASSDSMYYQPIWERVELEEATDNGGIGTILIFDRGEEAFYRQKGKADGVENAEKVIHVKPGLEYRELSHDIYQINPDIQRDYERLLEDLKKRDLRPTNILYVWNYLQKDNNMILRGEIDKCLARGIYSVFYITKAIMELKSNERVKLLYVFHHSKETIQPQDVAIAGFAMSLKLENPKFDYKTIQVDQNVVDTDVLDIAMKELQSASNGDQTEIRYEGGSRYARRVVALESAEEDRNGPGGEPLILKQNGVYLITGGAGGLGLIFARYIAGRYQARLVLTGRSELSDGKREQIREIEELGGEVLYIRADVCILSDMERVVSETKERFERIDGVIHSAGIIEDGFILKKDKASFEKVLGPKVHGLINLDWVTSGEKLGFFAMFSSLVSVIGNIGQCDYSSGNRFMDSYAGVREMLRLDGKRSGISLSINWPLWKEGGMKLREGAESLFLKTSGMRALSTEQGIKAFEDALIACRQQFIVIDGDKETVNRLLPVNRNESNYGLDLSVMDDGTYGRTGDETHINNVDQKNSDRKFQREQLLIETENYLKKILASEIKLPENKVDTHENFEKYGINSTMVMALNNILEDDFGSLSKTLFFEYSTLNDLAGYFVDNHRDSLSDILAINEGGLNTAPNILVDADAGIVSLERNRFIQKNLPELSLDIRQSVGFREEDVAIIGVSGKYPMANDLNEFWENLESGRDCITEIPAERWDYKAYFDSKKNKKGKSYSKWGGFIKDVDKFDPLFFRITPKDARLMDPQQRLFLEVVWSTLEDAGYNNENINLSRENSGPGDVGVFVGVMSADYQLFGVEENLRGNALTTNTSYWDIANRVSYFFNFQGPSLAIDTACSSSLTAIHMACESIIRRECGVAVAGGVNLSVHPRKYIGLSQFRFVSSDGKCRSFGEGGDGYVPGEGVGAILLKPLGDAVSDGDIIYAVIKGTSVNHGGKTNGYTVPNPNAQSVLIHRTLEKANINPMTLSYVEAHGTGTSLGDPIEIAGLSKAFRRFTQDKQFCPIGSVKSNIGHLEAAAGIAALTKVLLQMKYKKLVPSIHSEMLNSNIQFNASPFYVQRELCDWNKPRINENGKEKEYPRRAGISSFGAGGANAHMIIEEYDEGVLPEKIVFSDRKLSEIVILSAKDEDRLKEYVRVLKDYLIKAFKFDEEGDDHTQTEYSLKNISYTLQTGRRAFEQRIAIIVKSREELIKKLNEYLNQKDDIEDLFIGNVESGNNKKKIATGHTTEEKEFISHLVNTKKLSDIASFWAEGSEINWEVLNKERNGKRISLPTYPFARESYWMPIKMTTDTSSSLSDKDEKTSVLH